jgi:hypothetical protein
VKSLSSLAGVLLFAAACSAQSGPPKAALLDAEMRSARFRASVLNAMGDPIQYVGWNKADELRKITESQWVPVQEDGKKVNRRMFRYLLIPGAPWMAMGHGEIVIAAREGARAENAGEEGFHPLQVPGQEPMKVWMWKTAETNGKWVGVVDDKVYECGGDGAGAQIGWIAFRDLALDSGEVVKVFMTKGMAQGSAWEGDVADTRYREAAGGKGAPIAKLEYRPLKLPDGTETVVLMWRAPGGNAPWRGVRNGKILEDK